MRTLVIILFLQIGSLASVGQLNHQITIGKVIHTNYFNGQRDVFHKVRRPKSPRPLLYFPYASYKISTDSHGLEVFSSWTALSYYDYYVGFRYGLQYASDIPDSSIMSANSINIGLSYHYNFLDKKRINISGMFGFVYSYYRDDIHYYFIPNSTTHHTMRFAGRSDKYIGLFTGVNASVAIYKRLSASFNTRLFYHPLTGTNNPLHNEDKWTKLEYKENKGQLTIDIGLSYSFGRKNKK